MFYHWARMPARFLPCFWPLLNRMLYLFINKICRSQLYALDVLNIIKYLEKTACISNICHGMILGRIVLGRDIGRVDLRTVRYHQSRPF